MGSTYQTILATGALDDVRAAVAGSGQRAVVIPVGEQRWAVVPEDENGWAPTDDLARLLSRPAGALAAAFSVFDSDVLVAGLFREGRAFHDYLNKQQLVEPDWDDDDNEIQVDHLGRIYPLDATPPSGAYGADPAVFAPFALGDLDLPAVQANLTSEQSMANSQHHELLHLLGLDPRPLQMRYADAVKSGLGV
ncbi:hypothetical protein GCM10010435_08320 [Winogradskya consettensis]|uniref:Uncharacterized protein n=1 Tax=Winogradskya consettensis TaxID=113560 RepID=A0A919VVE8_9ACTN|nr:hypothetical protein [Actinoplanes consettensis]GIM80499.1 hypothetical protein Aco04nite_71040 [Actinoplanes consettensis]